MRGKLDTHAKGAGEKIDALTIKVDKLEDARTETFGKLVGHVMTLTTESATTKARQIGHEKECERRQDAIWERFDKVDRSLENINRQIISLATGQAGRAVEIGPRGDT